MKKFNVSEELGTKFTNPQILSVNNGNASCGFKEGERSHVDGSACCAADCNRDNSSDCHTPWWQRVLCDCVKYEDPCPGYCKCDAECSEYQCEECICYD